MKTSISSPGSMCQSIIFGSLTLRNTKNVILGGNLIFQNFEWSLSSSTFSQKLKISEIEDQNIRFTIPEKYLKSSGKLLFAISRYKINASRAVLS